VQIARIAATAITLWRNSGVLACFVASALLLACTAQRTAPLTTEPAAIAQPAAAAPEPAAAQKSLSWTVNGYKKDAALWISSVNKKNLFEGAPPPILKSIVVLSIAIDSEGQPTHVGVLRSNGYTDLEIVAVQSVHRAAPLPHPNRLIMHHGGVEYTETWLFRDDGRFQIRTLALPQAAGPET
jgi:periplasmic protein TonB